MTSLAEGMTLVFFVVREDVCASTALFLGFGLVGMYQIFVHSNETSKNILLINFRQFQIAHEQNASDVFLFRSQKMGDLPCGNLERPKFFCLDDVFFLN